MHTDLKNFLLMTGAVTAGFLVANLIDHFVMKPHVTKTSAPSTTASA